MPHFIDHRRVEFYETDLAGIVHFSNYYRYMESAEHAFFRSLGIKIAMSDPDGREIGWPRVATSCNYRAPARYEDVLEIGVTVVKRSSRTLTTSYEFRRDGQLLATGEMTTVCCAILPGTGLKSIDMPEVYVHALDRAIARNVEFSA